MSLLAETDDGSSLEIRYPGGQVRRTESTAVFAERGGSSWIWRLAEDDRGGDKLLTLTCEFRHKDGSPSTFSAPLVLPSGSTWSLVKDGKVVAA